MRDEKGFGTSIRLGDPRYTQIDTRYIEEMAKPLTAEEIAEQRAFLKTLKDREFAKRMGELLDKIEGERDV